MKWSGDPEKAFPARHPREPGGLRQDILDELSDHLGCALEHELENQKDGDEDAAWGRVLARFGDPDAMARKLWWDQMRETIMREWIQTGVTFVMAVALIAGLVLIMRLVAGVGTANEAMRDAMEQVAASNQALANAMAEQRADNEALLTALSGIQGGGGEKADALELSNIEIVVRRGTPEGPPAPEVKVKLEGQGDGALTVDAMPDSEGRVKFGPLIQGNYLLSFEDPVSGMWGSGSQTLFAGRGSDERLVLAPALTPRPVHIDFDLPKYGDDTKILFATRLLSTWEHDGVTWQSKPTVLTGHGGTRSPGDGLADSEGSRRVEAEIKPVPSLESMEIFKVSGDIRVDRIHLAVPGSNGKWRYVGGSFSDVAIELVSEDESGAHYAGKLPEKLATDYDNFARSEISRANLPGANTNWIDAAVAIQPGIVLAQWNALSESRIGELRAGLVYSASSVSAKNGKVTTGHSHESLSLKTGLSLSLPIDSAPSFSTGEKRFIGLHGVVQKSQITNMGSDRFESWPSRDDFLGNSLDAYAIRGDWRAQSWPDWNPGSPSPQPGVALPIDSEPYWRITGDELKEAMYDGKFLIPVPDETAQTGEQPVTGIFLRWQEDSESYIWSLQTELDTVGSEYPPCFIVTKPIAEVGD